MVLLCIQIIQPWLIKVYTAQAGQKKKGGAKVEALRSHTGEGGNRKKLPWGKVDCEHLATTAGPME